MSDRLEEIRERAVRATPGPWQWYGNTDKHVIYLAARGRGRMFVMTFARWGMQSVQPLFAVDREPGTDGWTSVGWMEAASRLARYEVAPDAPDRSHPSVYRADIAGVKAPDAEFIAHSRADVAWLLDVIDRVRALRDAWREQLDAQGSNVKVCLRSVVDSLNHVLEADEG